MGSVLGETARKLAFSEGFQRYRSAFKISNCCLKRSPYSLDGLARLRYMEGTHAPVLFVLIVAVIACNYTITYSLGDKTAYEAEGENCALLVKYIFCRGGS